MKVLPWIISTLLLAGMVFAHFTEKQPEIKINIDSLNIVNENLKAEIMVLSAEKSLFKKRVKTLINERDSLKEYQDKIYVYYEKKLDALHSMSDSSHIKLFNRLTR